MKIVTVIVRVLLGVVFFVFGLNGFVGFLPMPQLTGAAGAFIGALFSSHYLYLVAGVQLIAGVLLLINRFVPLALITTLLWALLVWRYRAHFTSLFVHKAG